MKHCLTATTLLAVSTARAFVLAPFKKATTSSLTTAFMSSSSSNDAFYSLTATAGDGSKVSMSDFKGLTQREYERFAALGEKYDDSQLQILAFPSQEFGGQEFGSDEEIAAFAAGQKFPGILLKLDSVVGDTAPGVWKHLRDATDSSDPGWNFDSKYLVSKTGEVSVPTTDVEDDVEKLIGE
ncbi:putative glutathione peroxidase [Fragilariopsis cylindrus CCMP1102]|uniref:Putative glutathione peroxidase n=1 Tax=Fragilariopsis cylindrus CCMP1102 TaxID=635003 RepID=A0A1E7FHF0_9STRA|nr:putative glutathione peroxidase [Fragilariopsis cylindrus CCMP1102]|eukprot:OEU17465.1 putative glutathione peroxidase [Fragilariopsis cylindrus CCMP1102]